MTIQSDIEIMSSITKLMEILDTLVDRVIALEKRVEELKDK